MSRDPGSGRPLSVFADTNALLRRLQTEHGDLDQGILRKVWNGHWPEEAGVRCERCGAELLADSRGVVEECPYSIVLEVLES